MKPNLQTVYSSGSSYVFRHILLFICVLSLLFIASTSNTKADGIGFNPNGSPARPGQLNVNGFTNMNGFNAPLTQYAYIYLEEGESLFYEIERSGSASSNTLNYSVYSPLGLVGTEQIASGLAGAGMYTDAIMVTAQTAGIWTLKMQAVARSAFGDSMWMLERMVLIDPVELQDEFTPSYSTCTKT